MDSGFFKGGNSGGNSSRGQTSTQQTERGVTPLTPLESASVCMVLSTCRCGGMLGMGDRYVCAYEYWVPTTGKHQGQIRTLGGGGNGKIR